ncbi:hypothetical protein BH11PSE11_BH11PSE11_00760 [soil metagenome]
MAKIILTDDGSLVREVPLAKERITIGRRAHNDIVIDDLAVSAEHAVIVTIRNDSFLEDLNSTNGTQINGQPVKKHFLQDSDVIELAHYRLRYVTESKRLEDPAAAANTAQRESELTEFSAQDGSAQRTPVIKILDGPSSGREIILSKALTTIGRPGTQVAVVARRGQDYYLTHVEGKVFPLVNGKAIDAREQRLVPDDVIELSGTRMRFAQG